MRNTQEAEVREMIKSITALRKKMEKLLQDYKLYKLTKEDMKNELKCFKRDYAGEEPFWVERSLEQVIDGQIPLIEYIDQMKKLEFTLEGYNT